MSSRALSTPVLTPRTRPAGAADRSYLPIAGDSAAAKATVTEFIDSIGYSVVDAGPLADSWRQATGTRMHSDQEP